MHNYHQRNSTVCLSVSLSVCLSACLSFSLSIFLSVRLSAYQRTCSVGFWEVGVKGGALKEVSTHVGLFHNFFG